MSKHNKGPTIDHCETPMPTCSGSTETDWDLLEKKPWNHLYSIPVIPNDGSVTWRILTPTVSKVFQQRSNNTSYSSHKTLVYVHEPPVCDMKQWCYSWMQSLETRISSSEKLSGSLSKTTALITWPLASEWTLSYATPQCVGMLFSFLYNPGHVTHLCLEVVPVVYAWEGIHFRLWIIQ